MKKLFVFLIVALMTFPVIAKDDKGNKAGGKRAEHASEMGLEKGKAYAGEKEGVVEKLDKDDKEGFLEKPEKEEKEKKQKKEKKEKKSK
jgi:competence protein ComGC